MEFLTIREFTASPHKIKETLRQNGKVILTNNGKPSMLVFDIAGKDFEALIDTLNRAEAMRLLEDIQREAVRDGAGSISPDTINTEIAAFRREREAAGAAGS